MSIREEIDRRLASNQVYYAHFVTNEVMQQIRKDTTNDILNIIIKGIDEQAIEFVSLFDVSVEHLDALENRLVDEIPSEYAFLKGLINIKNMCKK